MPDKKPIPGSSKEWLGRAKADLALARAPLPEGALYEDLCFHAQQAAEKAIKAVYVHWEKAFRYTHDIASLLQGLKECGIYFPDNFKEAAYLTDYASQRYPGTSESVTIEEYREAIDQADAVVSWAAEQIGLGKS